MKDINVSELFKALDNQSESELLQYGNPNNPECFRTCEVFRFIAEFLDDIQGDILQDTICDKCKS